MPEETSPAHDQSPDTKQLVKDMLAHLDCDHGSGKEAYRRPPTPGSNQVRSTERKEIKPLPLLFGVPCPGIGGKAGLLLWRDALAVEMDQRSVTAAKGMGISPRNVLPKGSTR